MMESSRGDLLVQGVPLRGRVGALESRVTTQAKKVEETTWRQAVVLVPLLSHCPQHFRFSGSCDIEIPSQFPWKRLVIPVFCFSVFCDLRESSSICFCQSSFGLLLFGRLYKSDCRIIISKHLI